MWAVASGGSLSKRYAHIDYLSYMPKTSQLVYRIMTRMKGKQRWKIKVGNTTSPYYNQVGLVQLRSDGKQWVYKAKIGRYWHIVTNGQLG